MNRISISVWLIVALSLSNYQVKSLSLTIATTKVPTANTRVPNTITRVPNTTTKFQITATKVPASSTKVPTTTTKVPTTTTKVQITATKVAATTTKAPTTTKKIATTTTKVQTSTKRVASTTTKVATTTTKTVTNTDNCARDFHDTSLMIHNYFRDMHLAPALVTNASLQVSATAWAEKIAKSGNFQHSGTTGVGENLAGIPAFQTTIENCGGESLDNLINWTKKKLKKH